MNMGTRSRGGYKDPANRPDSPPKFPRPPRRLVNTMKRGMTPGEYVRARRRAATPKSDKVAYVKRQGQTRSHHCHWPGCGKQVPPAMWGCYRHWMMLPKYLRDRVWAAFRPGQETNRTPSREYVAVAREVQDWIERHYRV